MNARAGLDRREGERRRARLADATAMLMAERRKSERRVAQQRAATDAAVTSWQAHFAAAGGELRPQYQ